MEWTETMEKEEKNELFAIRVEAFEIALNWHIKTIKKEMKE